LRKILPPVSASRAGDDNNGVRTATGESTRAAASTSADVTGKLGEESVMAVL
jgi:hypothetical protein